MIQKLTKLFLETWYFWLYCICLGFMTGQETDIAPMSRHVEFVSGLTFALLTAVWVTTDARRRQRAMGYGVPALVFMFWPIFAPIYLFETRGVRALVSLLGFIVVAFVTACIGIGIEMLTQK